jgi:hypothetical protein
MTKEEMEEFFTRSFQEAGMTVQRDAMPILSNYSAGFPKIMHLIGDEAYWADQDGVIDQTDAINAVISAAEEVGRRFVDQQVYRELRSKDYRSILDKIASLGPGKITFSRKEVVGGLTDEERRKFDNFLQKMKKLNVLRSGEFNGEYTFHVRMVHFYIWLESTKKKTAGPK